VTVWSKKQEVEEEKKEKERALRDQVGASLPGERVFCSEIAIQLCATAAGCSCKSVKLRPFGGSSSDPGVGHGDPGVGQGEGSRGIDEVVKRLNG